MADQKQPPSTPLVFDTRMVTDYFEGFDLPRPEADEWLLRVFTDCPPSTVAGASFKELCAYWQRWDAASHLRWYPPNPVHERKHDITRFGVGIDVDTEYYRSPEGMAVLSGLRCDHRPIAPGQISRHAIAERILDILGAEDRRSYVSVLQEPGTRSIGEPQSAIGYTRLIGRKRSNSCPVIPSEKEVAEKATNPLPLRRQVRLMATRGPTEEEEFDDSD